MEGQREASGRPVEGHGRSEGGQWKANGRPVEGQWRKSPKTHVSESERPSTITLTPSAVLGVMRSTRVSSVDE